MSTFVSGDDYVRLPRDPEPWVIKDLVSTGGMTNLYGAPKSLKTWAALGMSIAVGSGASHWLKFKVIKHGPVAYLQIDTPRSEWARRLNKLKRHKYDIKNVWFCDMHMSPYPYNILDAQHMKWLTEELTILKPVMLVIDTLREVHSGDENDSTPMKMVIANLVSASKPAAIVLISHSRKDNSTITTGMDTLMSDARGSSYVAGRMDTVVKFTKTSMTYKGRGPGEGKVTIAQNGPTGLVEMNAAAEAYELYLHGQVRQMLAINPEVSVNHMAETIAAGLQQEAQEVVGGKKKKIKTKAVRSITDDINEFIIQEEIEQDERDYAAEQTAA